MESEVHSFNNLPSANLFRHEHTDKEQKLALNLGRKFFILRVEAMNSKSLFQFFLLIPNH